MAVDMAERPPTLRDWRCTKCGRLLFRAAATGQRIEIVCSDRRCKQYQVVYLGSA
jgi:phage FluMu protein Com